MDTVHCKDAYHHVQIGLAKIYDSKPSLSDGFLSLRISVL